jgi:hypothetical protein
MSCCDNSSRRKPASSAQSGWLTGPRRLWLLIAAVAIGGLALGWEQLVLFGIAPILVSLLPCLVMCGLGLCMMKCKDKGKTTSPADIEAEGQARVDASRAATKETV